MGNSMSSMIDTLQKCWKIGNLKNKHSSIPCQRDLRVNVYLLSAPLIIIMHHKSRTQYSTWNARVNGQRSSHLVLTLAGWDWTDILLRIRAGTTIPDQIRLNFDKICGFFLKINILSLLTLPFSLILTYWNSNTISS